MPTKNEVRLRRAIVADADLLAHLNRFVHDLHVVRRPDQFKPTEPAELARWFRERLGQPTTQAWIAEESDRPVGFALAMHHQRPPTPFAPARDWFEIDQIAVDPEYRKRGIGRWLLDTAIAAARDLGIREVEVTSWSFNEDIQRLLRQVGFKPKLTRFELT
jgi:GNAT superfamily N-acetyltransferase